MAVAIRLTTTIKLTFIFNIVLDTKINLDTVSINSKYALQNKGKVTDR